jgi:predicted alpha/beta hydrolase
LIEEVEIRCADRVTLRAAVREPRGDLVGTAVLAHAMFARKTEFERAGFAAFFAARGWRTIALDFRGHGDSDGKGTEYAYDDFVLHDLPAATDAARVRGDGKPVVVVGHSLGGHVALASQGIGALGADAIVALATNVWLRETEPSMAVRAIKRATMRAIRELVDRRGHFPARALRQGSDDESATYMRDLARFTSRNAWCSTDGTLDYRASMRKVGVPVYALASTGDRLNARPVSVRRFAAWVGSQPTVDVVTESDDGGHAPGHMEIVTTRAVVRAWGRAEEFLRARLA